MIKPKTHFSIQNHYKYGASPAKLLAELISNEYAKFDRNIIIAVGGPGGTGKSTFCKQLSTHLLPSSILHLDDYKTPRAERADKKIFGAHPKANNIQLICEHLYKIKNNKTFAQPIYNAITGTADSTRSFKPERFTILDGEISTYKHFREFVDFAIFIDADWKTQLQTRLTRDITIRQYSYEKAIATFLQSNLREFKRFGAESKMWADVHIYCNDDYLLTIESISKGVYQRNNQLFNNDSNPLNFQTLAVPLLTPFDKNNQIDLENFVKHLEYLAQKNIHQVLLNTHTGEYYTLDKTEKQSLLLAAKEFFPGIILYQINELGLNKINKEIKYTEKYGMDGIYIPSLFFEQFKNQVSQNFMQDIFKGTDLPILVPNSVGIDDLQNFIKIDVPNNNSNIPIKTPTNSQNRNIPNLKTALSQEIVNYPVYCRWPLAALA